MRNISIASHAKMFYTQIIKAVVKIKINEIIKQRRMELGLTLKDIAKALNVSESTVSRYESSEIQNMGIDKIEALSKILKCSPGYLMGWISEKELPNKDQSITDKEKELLNKYNELDEKGKHTVNTVLDMEYNRCMGEKEYIPHTIAAHADGLTEEQKEDMINMALQHRKNLDK